jgi:hypothetical protein
VDWEGEINVPLLGPLRTGTECPKCLWTAWEIMRMMKMRVVN